MSKSSDSMSPQSQKELRICLVGDVAYDQQVTEAAKSLKLPIERIEDIPELINESKWLTFFVLKDFNGPTFEEIHKSKQCVLGPPALKQIARMSNNLLPNARPLYNYSMRGVVTCFTGIRKKDELTRLVTLIHAMGGCIRKDMNSKITHLISNHSSGEKYRYAKTFRLTVVRPDWVYAAWERRDEVEFVATTESFSQEYKLKPFEGQKICFFGFPTDEHQHMVDVLLTNGGIATELDDPECSHVVMPNNVVGYLPKTEIFAKTKSITNAVDETVDVVVANAATATATITKNLDSNGNGITKAESEIQINDENFKCNELERIALTYESEKSEIIKVTDETKSSAIIDDIDGIVLESEEDMQKFQFDISYISPILANNGAMNAEADSQAPSTTTNNNFGDASIISQKRSKFLRTGSIARKIRYSMTVVADNTPFLKGKQRQRRSSFYGDTAANNDSIITMNETAMSNASNAEFGLSSTATATTHKLNESKRKDTKKEKDKHKDESFKIKTPIARILRPRRYLTRSGSKCTHAPTNGVAVRNTDVAAAAKLSEVSYARKRRHSEESDSSRIITNDNNDISIMNSECTPKGRKLRPRRCVSAAAATATAITAARNLTIAGATRKLHDDDENSHQKRMGETFSESTRNALKKSNFENDEDFFDFDGDGDGFDETIDSCQLSFASQMSKKSKVFLGSSDTMKRTIRRSIHYVSEKTPLSKLLRRSRRGSITSVDGGGNGCNATMYEPSRSNTARPYKRARIEYTAAEAANNVSIVPEFKTPKVPIIKTPLINVTPTSTSKTSLSSTLLASSSNANSLPQKITTITTTKTAVASAAAATTTTTLTATSANSISSTIASVFVQENIIQEATRSPPLLSLRKKANINASNAEMVVDEHSTQVKPNPANVNTHILKSDWFWYTIQNGYADETDYLFGDYLDSIANTPDPDRRESLPISLNKRKRKRFSQRLQFEGSPLGVGKRRSSISDAVYSSFSDSFLDCTTSPDASKIYVVEPETSVLESQTPAKKSLRFYHFMDFVNTESNYVGILDTIVTLFKIPLEKMYEDGDALLNHTEIKSIFGNFLSIHEVHQRMLQRLRQLQNQWTEDCLIGEIILELKDELIKSYPPYINFFESMKEMLAYCDNQNPRFHAFLKINQTKPECGRQSLQDLMIRPVQRLPSISLLLNDILKHTAKTNPDYLKLEEALKAIKEVMTYINEDKRKTESRVAIFDIFNDIEGCPAHLVSSNRSFISKCEVVELSDELSGRGDALVFYLFSDTIEVCKKRSRGFNAAKSPGSAQKTFKHVKLLPLNAIRFVIDIIDSPRAFALLCRQDKDKLYSFTIVDEEIDKIVYIKTVCKQMAQHACRADAEKSLLSRTSQELDVDISNVNLSTLSKAFKLAARTRLKVGRAFSFNKTPSKLKRAVSTMMTSPFGSTNALALTPASQLAQMRLASCTNIHEATNEDGSSTRSNSPPILLEPPFSVQPERKHKTSTLNSLGRL